MSLKPAPLDPAWERALAAFEADLTTKGIRSAHDYARRVRRLAREVSPSGPWSLSSAQVQCWLDGLPTMATDHLASVRRFYAWAISDGRAEHNPAPPCRRPGPRRAVLPAAWQSWADCWRSYLLAAGFPETTVDLRVHQLGRISRQLGINDPAAVTGNDLVEWFAAAEIEIETRRSYRSACRQLYGWAVETGRVATNPALALPRVRPAAANPHPASDRAYTEALAEADHRERLMLRLAAEIGLRRGEVARVHTRDLLQDDDGWSLLVHGKGNRDRVVPLPAGLAADLRSTERGWAFPGPAGHLTAGYIGKRIAELLPAGVSMHALRHRFATRAYDLEHDVFTVQQLLGHASPNTTRRYVKVTRDTMRRTVLDLADRDVIGREPLAVGR